MKCNCRREETNYTTTHIYRKKKQVQRIGLTFAQDFAKHVPLGLYFLVRVIATGDRASLSNERTHEVVLRRRHTQAAKRSVLLLCLIAPLAFAVAHCIASRVLGQRTVVLSTLRSCSDTLVIPVVVSRFPSASCPGVFWHPCRTWFAAVVFFVTMPETCLSWCLSLDRKQEVASNMSKTQLQIAQVIARALHGLSREQQLDSQSFPTCTLLC